MSKQPPSTATQFDQFLAEEVRKVQGIWYPVKPTLLSRIFVRHAPLRKLHPNPEDEFCQPDIGPNHAIISQYERDFVEFGPNKYLSSSSSQVNASEPLEVQKIRPDGYMILNGHHRWAAASRVGIQRLRIHIINLTLKDDIERMLKTSRYDQRVTLDLDETVFCPFPGRSDGFEKKVSFPFRFLRRQRIRLGIPALFQFLSDQGYDIWVYTARYLSLDSLRFLFRYYRCPVTGLVTGTARKAPAGSNMHKSLETMMKKHYQSTVHIDNKTILQTFTDSKEFREAPIDASSDTWSLAVMNAFKQLQGPS